MSKTYPSLVRRPSLRRAFLLALVPAVLLVGHLAKAEVVRVPTEDGGTWTITISPADRIVAALDDQPAPPAEAENPFSPPQAEPTPQAEAIPTPMPEESSTPMPPAPAPQAETQLPETPDVVAPELYESPETGIAIIPNGGKPSPAAEYRRIYESVPYSRTEYLANPSYRHDTAMELLTGIPRQSAGQGNYVPRLNEPTSRSPLFLYNRYGGVGPYYGSGGVSSYHGGFGLGYRYVPQYAPAFRYFLPLEDLY